MSGTAFAVFTAVLLLCCALCLYRIGTRTDRSGPDGRHRYPGNGGRWFLCVARAADGKGLSDERGAGLGAGEFHRHPGAGQALGRATSR